MKIVTIETSGTGGPTFNGSQRKLLVDSTGKFHAIYPGTNTIRHATSIDNGDSWSIETVCSIETGDWTLSEPAIAIDSSDNIHLVYRAPRSDINKIYYRKYTGSWGGKVSIANESVQGAYLPAIAVDGNDNVYIVWQQPTSTSGYYGMIWVRECISGSWGSIIQLYSDETNYGDYNTAIEVDSNNNVYVAYFLRQTAAPIPTPPYIIGDYNAWMNKKTGSSWGEPIQVSTDNYLCEDYVAMTIDENDHVHFFWGLGGDGTRYREYDGTNFVTDYQEIAPIEIGDVIELFSSSCNQLGVIHGMWSKNNNSIYHISKVDGVWNTAEQILEPSTNRRAPVMLWSNYPVIDGIRINVPTTGYAFLFSDDTTVKFAMSDDFSFEPQLQPIDIQQTYKKTIRIFS
jgi:hypothetical protein